MYSRYSFGHRLPLSRSWQGRARLRLILAGVLTFVVAFSATTGLARAQSPPLQPSPPGWVADELLVGIKPGVSPAQAQGLFQSLGATQVDEIPQINVRVIKVAPSALKSAQQALSHRPEVEYVEKNYLLSPELVPNDSYYPSEWHLPKISGPGAWDISQGVSNAIIAVLDSGVDCAHLDLGAKCIAGWNFYDNTFDTSDVYGHGTKVAGSATALSNNGTGVASVAWRNLLMPIRVTDTQGYGYVSAIAQGLTWAVDHGAKVMNLSFGGVAGISTITSAAQYVVNHGGLVVAAAGNCGCFDSTAENPYIISVSATDSNDNLASFSSTGNYVDLAAPGVSIYTTTKGGGYGGVSGTSFSSPITVGVAALVMSVNPTLTPANVETLLEASADDRGPAGYDTSFGFGRVNAYKAVLAASGTPPPSPDTTPPSVSIDTPATGSTVQGGVTVTVAATDNTGVTQVNLSLDGALYASDTTAPYSFYWDTTKATNGSHSLTATATDATSNVGTSAPDAVSVGNVTDTILPTVGITSAVVTKNKMNVSVTATDNVGVVKVELYLDGQLKGTDTAAPYSFSFSIQSLSSGTHTLQAKAYDAAGNVGSSNPVSFTK